MSKVLDVVVVGATGAVGQEMLRVLHQRGFPVGRVRAVASARSAGGTVRFGDRVLTLESPSYAVFEGAQLALFSAGATVSRVWAPVAASVGCLAIDNSSAWRMEPTVPLVIPEVNPERIPSPPRGIVANPNCSTIQLLVALKPLHDAATLEHIVVATYQAVSGKGARALAEFEAQERAVAAGTTPPVEILPGVLAGNLLSDWQHDASGYSEEELKVIGESRKILDLPSLPVSPTCVRVPVKNAHSEAVWARFSRAVTREEALRLLRAAPGVQVMDDIGPGRHPQPREVSGSDSVHVGRVRQDMADPRALHLWVVGDNLRKGAALNAVQIAERAFGVVPRPASSGASRG